MGDLKLHFSDPNCKLGAVRILWKTPKLPPAVGALVLQEHVHVNHGAHRGYDGGGATSKPKKLDGYKIEILNELRMIEVKQERN
jgi:hypothetical protein